MFVASDECPDVSFVGTEQVKNWYLDMSLIKAYLVGSGAAPRAYHHTAPIRFVHYPNSVCWMCDDSVMGAAWSLLCTPRYEKCVDCIYLLAYPY
jgi:hypothetical protein